MDGYERKDDLVGNGSRSVLSSPTLAQLGGNFALRDLDSQSAFPKTSAKDYLEAPVPEGPCVSILAACSRDVI